MFLTVSSATATPISFAGYIQSNSNQDLALLSSNIGDGSFSVTFSGTGQIGFSYFDGAASETATLNLVDQSQGAGLSSRAEVYGDFAVTIPSNPSSPILGSVYVLPPETSAAFTPVQQTFASVVPGESVVRFSSLVPVIYIPACLACGMMPFTSYDVNFGPVTAADTDAPEPSTWSSSALALLVAASISFRNRKRKASRPSNCSLAT